MISGSMAEKYAAITIKDDAAKPHSFGIYFGFLYMMLGVVFVRLELKLRLDIINKNQSPFEINRLFMASSIVALSVAVIATLIMVVTNYYYLSIMMKDIHYTILKIVGCYSAILAPFSLGMVLFAPRSNTTLYQLSCLVIFGIVVATYWFVLRDVIRELEEAYFPDNYKQFPKVHYAGLLVPVSLLLVLFVPDNHNLVALFHFIMALNWLLCLARIWQLSESPKGHRVRT